MNRRALQDAVVRTAGGNGAGQAAAQPLAAERVSDSQPLPPRRADFGPPTGWLEPPVLRRSDLATPRAGPGIVEECDATCVIPPRTRAALEGFGKIAVDLSP